MLILTLMPFILFFLSLISVGFWKGSLVPFITDNFSKERLVAYDRFFRRASLTLVTLCFLFIVFFGKGKIIIWDIILFGVLALLTLIITKNKIHNKNLLDLNFFKNKILNEILSGLFVPYIFVFIWVRMIFVFLGY